MNRPAAMGPWMGAEFTLGARSHIGKQRVANEDAYCVLAGPNAPDGSLACFAVADGMGGHRAGEVASSLAIKELTRLLGARRFGHSSGGGDPQGGPLLQDVQAVNREVHRASRSPDLIGMGTTLTVGLIIRSTLHLAHVGDTRAYLLRDGRLQQLTRDHSWAEEQVEAGLLTPDQAIGHPGRNVLTRALGVAQMVDIDVAELSLLQRDILLVCSDGLYSQVMEEDILRILSKEEPQDACERLIDRANQQGGRDNITAIVLRLDRVSEAVEMGGSATNGESARDDGRAGGMWSRLVKAMRLSKS
ncbi:MAG: protein serine/threonine phosphatase [Dehalococcoidia bacterium]|nr:protein serine/threonine phosphatase [Dehalococcoidia bacterium]